MKSFNTMFGPDSTLGKFMGKAAGDAPSGPGFIQKIKNIHYEDHSRKIHTTEWRRLKESTLLKYKKNNTILNNWHG